MLSYRAGRYNGVLEDCEIESLSMDTSNSINSYVVLEDCKTESLSMGNSYIISSCGVLEVCKTESLSMVK